MAVTFLSDDWAYTKTHITKRLEDFRNILEAPDRTYKEHLLAMGRVLAYKEILNLPQDVFNVSAANNKGNIK